MDDVYLTLFLIGFLYAVGSVALLGLGHFGVHLPGGHSADGGHADLTAPSAHDAVLHHGNGHGATADATPAARAAPTVSPFNLTVLMTFLLGFGGAGYVLTAVTSWPALLVGTGAAAAGLAEATVVYSVLRLLRPGQGFLRASDSDLVGTLARVSVPIRPDGIGEVVYTQLGSRHSVGARSANGQAIAMGTEVVITTYDRGIAVVEPWDQFRGMSNEG